jgi:lipid II:glycine glycyltransferase (peptidoglycan interpeptide bridge formation enzyme)
MNIRLLSEPADLTAYDERVHTHPHGSLWQSTTWKKYQEALTREVRTYANDGASALVVIDRTTGGFSTWEIPRGPLWTNEAAVNDLLKKIVDDAKVDRCIELFVSPITPLPTTHYPLTASSRHVQPQATRVIDLTKSEEEILAQMHPKGRYNIGVAKKHGIEVKEGSIDDLGTFYALLKSTSSRDGFQVSSESHYRRFLSGLDQSLLLLAMHQGKAIAGLLGVQWGTTAIYYYGASSYEHRQLMAPYLLQWHAMQRAKAAECTHYDLLGVSPEPAPKDDPWIGISDFKRKFGGSLVNYPREQSIVLRPLIKTVLALKRKILG